MRKVIYYIKKTVNSCGEHNECLKSLFKTKSSALIELEKLEREYENKEFFIAPVEGKNNAFLAISDILEVILEYGEVEITI